jgi:transposase
VRLSAKSHGLPTVGVFRNSSNAAAARETLEAVSVSSPEMGDKQEEQPRGRANGAIRSAVADAQRGKIRPLLPKRWKRPKGGGPAADDRRVLEAILWILSSGARRCGLPEVFPSPATCFPFPNYYRLRRFLDGGEAHMGHSLLRYTPFHRHSITERASPRLFCGYREKRMVYDFSA